MSHGWSNALHTNVIFKEQFGCNPNIFPDYRLRDHALPVGASATVRVAWLQSLNVLGLYQSVSLSLPF